MGRYGEICSVWNPSNCEIWGDPRRYAEICSLRRSGTRPTARSGCSRRFRALAATAWPAGGGARSPEITPDHPRSPEVARDHPRSPEMIRDRPRSPEIVRDRPRSPEIAVGGRQPHGQHHGGHFLDVRYGKSRHAYVPSHMKQPSDARIIVPGPNCLNAEVLPPPSPTH